MERILIIEDEKDVNRLLAQALQDNVQERGEKLKIFLYQHWQYITTVAVKSTGISENCKKITKKP